MLAKQKTKWGDREGRRRDILAAARGLLEETGYQGFTIRDVADGAGVSLGTVYTYFGSKEELFATLYAERLDRFQAEIEPVCASAETAEQLLAAIAERYLDVYRVFGRELEVWSLVPGDVPPEVAAPLVESAGRVFATVQGGLQRFAVLDDAGLVVPFLWATLNGLADHFTSRRHLVHPYGWDDLVAFAARTIVAGLGIDKKKR
jgi:AcrR family transcriptional regulator